jgi:hypothetical protein
MRPREELGPELELPTLARHRAGLHRIGSRVGPDVVLIVLVVEGLHALGLT